MMTKTKDYKNEFDDITIVEVWKKATPLKQFELYKKDIYGSLMFFDDFGVESVNGWVIAYIKSKSEGGSDDLENLLPLHWKNSGKNMNFKKSETL